MSLKEQLAQKAASLVRREKIALPATGMVVQVRGMMTGEAVRVAELKGEKQTATMVALVTEDPEGGAAIWKANDLRDHQAILALPIADTTAIMDAANRLSGLSGGNANSESGTSSDTPSPSDSGGPSPN